MISSGRLVASSVVVWGAACFWVLGVMRSSSHGVEKGVLGGMETRRPATESRNRRAATGYLNCPSSASTAPPVRGPCPRRRRPRRAARTSRAAPAALPPRPSGPPARDRPPPPPARRRLGEHVVEVVAVDVDDLAVLQRFERFGRLAGEVGHYADDERQLDFLHRAVGLDVVSDLDARPAHPVQLVLETLCHEWTPAVGAQGWDE